MPCRSMIHVSILYAVRLLSFGLLLSLGVPAVAKDASSIVQVRLQGSLGADGGEIPVTFGQVFKKGDVPVGKRIGVVNHRRYQVDPKRTYDDGSLRFAVVSLMTPPSEEIEVLHLATTDRAAEPKPAPVSLDDLVQTGFDAEVILKFPDGTVRSTSVQRLMIQSAIQPITWLEGPICSEWIFSGPPVDRERRPDEDLNVQFHVRVYAGGSPVRVSVVVENCWDTWAGNIRYDAEVKVAGKSVFQADAVDHRRLSRWRKVFWYGGDEPRVHVAHDLGYMTSAGALPNYDRTLALPDPPKSLESLLQLAGPQYEIMGRGALTAYMPTTGGRWEIGPYPAWTARYLLSMDPRFKRLVLANGDLAGSWPIHVRARKTRRVMTIDQRPGFWLDQRGKDRPNWKPDRHAAGADYERLSPDIAHQPSLAYVPYLVTGDYYYLEEACYWANFCLLATWNHPRQDAQGILSGQVRGNAWALRNIADAASVATDGDPEAAYFDEKIRNNIADRTHRMLGPPEYNQIGAWHPRTVENARIQNPANPKWMVNCPWELDYLTWSLHHLVELGYSEAAKPRDFLLRQRVGMLTNSPDFDPMLATPYRCVIGEKTADGGTLFFEDWKKLGRENARLSKPEIPNFGCSFAYSARVAAVCGVDGGFPKAAEAVKWLEDHLPNHREVMAREPFWAIASGGAAAGKR